MHKNTISRGWSLRLKLRHKPFPKASTNRYKAISDQAEQLFPTNQLVKIAMSRTLTTTLSIFCFLSSMNVAAESVTQRSAIEQVTDWVETIRVGVDACVINVDIVILGLQAKQSDPNNPTGLTSLDASERLHNCPKTSLTGVSKLKTARVDGNVSSISFKCKAALDELYYAYMGHLENFASYPTESMQDLRLRVRAEAQQIKQQAIRARMICLE